MRDSGSKISCAIGTGFRRDMRELFPAAVSLDAPNIGTFPTLIRKCDSGKLDLRNQNVRLRKQLQDHSAIGRAMSVKNADTGSCSFRDALIERRTLIVCGLASTLPPLGILPARADVAAARAARPQPGDHLVFMSGDRREQIIRPADLTVGAPPTLAFPMDLASRSIRDASRVNMIVLLRVPPNEITESTRSRAADDIVAYSAICTHYGCPVTGLDQTETNLACKCHGSIFDPRNNAEVLAGPAPRRLAALPIKLEDGELRVAAGFSGAVGQQR